MYEEKSAALAAMEAAKAANSRQEWVLNRWQIGKCEWTEGFEREYPDGSIAPTLSELREGLILLLIKIALHFKLLYAIIY